MRVVLARLALVGGLIGALVMSYGARAALVSGPAVVSTVEDRVGLVTDDVALDISTTSGSGRDGREGDTHATLLAATKSANRSGYDQSHRLSRGTRSRSFDQQGAGACLDFKPEPRRVAAVFGDTGRGDRGHGDSGHGDRHDRKIAGGDWIYDFNRDHHDNRDNPRGAWGRSHHDWSKHHWHHGHGPPAIPLPPAVWLFGSALLGLAIITRRRPAHKNR